MVLKLSWMWMLVDVKDCRGGGGGLLATDCWRHSFNTLQGQAAVCTGTQTLGAAGARLRFECIVVISMFLHRRYHGHQEVSCQCELSSICWGYIIISGSCSSLVVTIVAVAVVAEPEIQSLPISSTGSLVAGIRLSVQAARPQ